MKLNKVIEIAALSVGGVSLFLMSFLVFALAAGVPANEVAVIGSLFPEPEAPTTSEELGLESAAPKITPRTPDEVLASAIGRLPAFSGPSPFEDGEVERLVGELKTLKLRLSEDVARAERREEDLDEREAALEETSALIQELMAELDLREADIALAQEELARDQSVADEAQADRFQRIGVIFDDEETDAATMAKRLERYPAGDAARILANVSEERRTALLNALSEANFQEFLDAYAALGY